MEKLHVKNTDENTQELWLGKRRIAIYRIAFKEIQIFKLGFLTSQGLDMSKTLYDTDISSVYSTKTLD